MTEFKRSKSLGLLLLLLFLLACAQTEGLGAEDPDSVYRVAQTEDFEITGDGGAEDWSKAEWFVIPQRYGEPLMTRAKVLYSDAGMYFLFENEDRKLTSTMDADFMDLWKEDVVEVFLWTDEAAPVYFEYELSPLNYELPILVSNLDGDLVRWKPFHYDDDRKTRHATTALGGERESGAAVTGWTAEFFIPYKLLRPLNKIPAKPGTRWRANFYRVDYDDGERAGWSWQLTTINYHEYKKFGTLVFE